MARGGRGGGRGGGRSGPLPRDVQVSKKLSWLLRHGAEKEGLTLGKGGYINLAEVLDNRNLKSLQPRPSLPEIQTIVATNEKQRFSLITASAYEALSQSPSGSASSAETLVPAPTTPKEFYIRANQGHSLALSSEGLLTPIIAATPPSDLPRTVVHGTRRQLWSAILASGGLKPMGRMHVHFAMGVPRLLASTFALDKDEIAAETSSAKAGDAVPEAGAEEQGGGALPADGQEQGPGEKQILSGMRNSSSLLIFLDLRRALADGLEFFVSANGVVLSPGASETAPGSISEARDAGAPAVEGGKGEQGIISTRYFAKVVEKGGKVLWRDGFATP